MVEDESAPPALDVRGLSVRYGARTAVDRLSFAVRRGEIYGLLGSNGAGKTSTMKCLVGLLAPSEGSIRVGGVDPVTHPVAVKSRTGYVPETALLFDALTPREFLEFVAGVRRSTDAAASARVAALSRAVQVERELDQPIGLLSMGTRQKVLLVAALFHRPELLVLDEPFHGLDPRSVRVARELLRQQADLGVGVLLSTHTMEVAERLCDRVGILDQGRLCGEGTIPELLVEGSATLEEAFLRITREEDGVRDAVRTVGAA